MIENQFQWIFTGIDLSYKLLWFLVFPLRMIMWCSNIVINFIILGIVLLIFCLFTGQIPEQYVTSSMDTIGQKAIHYIDPKGEKSHSLLKKDTSINVETNKLFKPQE